MQLETQIYFLRAPLVGLIKIGRSVDIERRLSEIRLISPVKLELFGFVPGDWTLESEYHRKWSHLRQHGEWFTETDDLRNSLEADMIVSAWNRACPEARDIALQQIDSPVFDNARAA